MTVRQKPQTCRGFGPLSHKTLIGAGGVAPRRRRPRRGRCTAWRPSQLAGGGANGGRGRVGDSVTSESTAGERRGRSVRERNYACLRRAVPGEVTPLPGRSAVSACVPTYWFLRLSEHLDWVTREARWRRRCCRVHSGCTVGSPTTARELY